MYSLMDEIWALLIVNTFLLYIILVKQSSFDSSLLKRRFVIDYDNSIQHLTYDPAYDDWVGNGVIWMYSSEYWVEKEAIEFKEWTRFFIWVGLSVGVIVFFLNDDDFFVLTDWLTIVIYCLSTISFIYGLFRLWWGKIVYMRNNTWLINNIKIARGHKKSTLYNYHARHGFQINEKNLTPKQSKDLNNFLYETCSKREWWLEGYAEDDDGILVKKRKYLEKLRKSRG